MKKLAQHVVLFYLNDRMFHFVTFHFVPARTVCSCRHMAVDIVDCACA